MLPDPDHIKLADYFNQRLKDLERLFDERVRSLEKRLDERFRTQTTSVLEARKVVDGRLAEMNNLRFQIEGERKSYLTKGEFTLAGVVAVAVGVIVSLVGMFK